MHVSRRLGFRSLLVLALSLAFIGAFSLLSVTAVQLGQRERDAARRDAASSGARLLDQSLGTAPTHTRFAQSADALLGITIRGVELEQPTGEPWVHGVTGLGDPLSVTRADGTELRVWLRPLEEGGEAATNLLLLYVTVTGGLILLLTYLALTHLIVRPVENLTRASERVATGQSEVVVPVRGAKEVAQLADAFNTMARQLADERAALVARLEDLQRTTRELESAEQQVERSAHLASVGRLAAGVAHEIGNPLTAISGLVELSADPTLDEEKRTEFLRRVQGETERIHRIIRDLLDYARPDDQHGSSDMAEVIAGAVRLVAPQSDARGLRIERRVEECPRVRGDSDRLTQVVLNLLLNAADAVDGEGEVVIELRVDEDEVVFAVSDTGPGISDDLLPTLFEPFVTSKPVGQGTGLGLAVSHTIVDRLGGSIQATNPSEGGARFEVRLPKAT